MGKQKSVILLFVSMSVSLGLTQLACNTTDRPVTTPAFVVTQGPTNTPCGYPGNTCTPTFTFTETFTNTPTPTNTATPCIGFGSNTSGSYGYYSAQIMASRYYLSSSSTIDNLWVYTLYGTQRVSAALYQDGGSGAPSNLIVQSASQPAIAGWSKIPITHTALSAGYYWIATQIEYGYYVYYYTGNSNDQWASHGQAYGAFPSVWSAGNGTSYVFPAFADTCP